MNNRELYLRNAQKVLDEAIRRNNENINLCEDCNHQRTVGILSDSICIHPIVQLAQRNILDDDFKKQTISETTYQRGSSEYFGPVVCGPDGELFEPREESYSLWNRFIHWLFN